MEYIYVIAGLICLFFGGDWLVKGAIALSAKLGLPTFLISLTVVGFGTSVPELLVSIQAAMNNAPGIALGNVVGSNIANILLIIGLAAIIAPIQATKFNLDRDLFAMLISTLLLVSVLFIGLISFAIGAVMVLSLVAYLTFAYFQDRVLGAGEIEVGVLNTHPAMIVFLLVAGLSLLAGGADLLVRGATIVAADLGVSNAVIGLSVVAVGTSLPELATSITSALKHKPEIAIGNVVGSNIFNILAILGVTSVIAPIPVAERFVAIDGWMLLTVTVILFALLFFGRGISRLTGVIFLMGYMAYIFTMV